VLQHVLLPLNSAKTACASQQTAAESDELWRHGEHMLMQLQLFITGIHFKKYLIKRIFFN